MKFSTEQIKRLAPLVFALVLGLLAMRLLHQYLERERAKLKQEWQRLAANYQNPVSVVVAAKDLEAGSTLEAAHLKFAEIPDRYVQPYATKTPQELLGKVTMAPVAEGEQVLLNKVRRPEDVPLGSTLSTVMPKGKRAVTISVDAITGVGGFVRPGDKVDILWTVKIPGPQDAQAVTMTLFQQVPVLAVGREMVGRSRQQAEPAAEYNVTLSLTPQETSFLLFAREQGRIQLSLRAHTDAGMEPIPPTSINSLLESQLGMKAGPPPPLPPVKKAEIYKGLKRDVVVLSDPNVLAEPSP